MRHLISKPSKTISMCLLISLVDLALLTSCINSKETNEKDRYNQTEEIKKKEPSYSENGDQKKPHKMLDQTITENYLGSSSEMDSSRFEEEKCLGGVAWVINTVDLISEDIKLFLILEEIIHSIKTTEFIEEINRKHEIRSGVLITNGYLANRNFVYDQCCRFLDHELILMIYFGEIGNSANNPTVLPLENREKNLVGYSSEDNIALSEYGLDTANWIIIVNAGTQKTAAEDFLVPSYVATSRTTNCVFEILRTTNNIDNFLESVNKAFQQISLSANDLDSDGFIDSDEFAEILSKFDKDFSVRLFKGMYGNRSLLIRCK